MKDFSNDEYISFEEFIESISKFDILVHVLMIFLNMYIGIFCRSNNQELDSVIFQMFDLGKTKSIDLEEITMLLINLPDIGFSNQQNINLPDRFYSNIKDSIIKHV